MKIYLGADHAGFELKNDIKTELEAGNFDIEDLGALEFDPNDDYPDMSLSVAKAVVDDPGSLGIIVGGSGQGEAMAANTVRAARAAVFYGPVAPKQSIDVDGQASADPYTIVRLGRLHNDANILSIGARFVTPNEAKTAVRIFVDTEFENIERHVRRIAKF